MKWPGVTKAGAVDRRHMVSAVDFLPTILEAAGLALPEGMDGRSFAPLVRGETQDGRDRVFKEYNESAGRSRNPMRGVQTRDYLYLFNPWSNGKHLMGTATNGTATWKTMLKLAPHDRAIAARVDLLKFRKLEELYHVRTDPDCLRNLVDDPKHAAALKEMRTTMLDWMDDTGDHARETMRHRDDPRVRAAYMVKVTEEMRARSSKRKKKQGKQRKHFMGGFQLLVFKKLGNIDHIFIQILAYCCIFLKRPADERGQACFLDGS